MDTTISTGSTLPISQEERKQMIELTPEWKPNGGRPECDGKATCPHLYDECGKDNI